MPKRLECSRRNCTETASHMEVFPGRGYRPICRDHALRGPKFCDTRVIPLTAVMRDAVAKRIPITDEYLRFMEGG